MSKIQTCEKQMDLKVTVVHDTWDMSVHNFYSRCVSWEMRDMKVGATLDLRELDGGVLTILSVSDDVVILEWGEEEYAVPMNSVIETPAYRVQNPYLTADSVNLIFEYRALSEKVQ